MATILLDFVQILRLVYECRLMLEKTVSISNWVTQSVANRLLPYPVKMTAKRGNQTIVVQLAAGWQPARQGAGYNAEDVKTSRSVASNIWSMYANSNIPEKQAGKEVIALLGYFLSHLVTGIPLSYENSGKIEFLDVILKGLNLSAFSFEMQVSEHEVVKYDLIGLNNLVSGLKPVSGRFLSNLKADEKKSAHARLDILEEVSPNKPAAVKKARKATNKVVNPPAVEV